jgi:hypothetical protein
MKNQEDGKKVGKIGELLYVVIRALNSGKKIDLKVYQHVCHMIGILVITKFPWARMNETLHDVGAVSSFMSKISVSCLMEYSYYLA